MKVFITLCLTLTISITGFGQSNPVKKNELQRGSRSVPQICLVTVDLDSNWNHIFWDKTGLDDAAYFKIYRETPTGSTVYLPIDTVHADSLSQYTDKNVNTYYGSYRYKISVIDTLGIEGPMSLFHRTIFCDEPIEGDFNWDDYEIEGSPSPVVDFVMLRKDTVGAPWVPIDTVSGSITNFTDINHALFPAGEWRVRTIWPITCTPTRAGVSTSRSNLRTKNMIMSIPNGPIQKDDEFNVYPNPATDVVIVEFRASNDRENIIQIRDAAGRLIATKTTLFNKVQFRMDGFEAGPYFIEAVNSTGKSTKIFIKN